MDLYRENVENQIKKEIIDFDSKIDIEQICLLRDFTFRHIPFALRPEAMIDYQNVCSKGRNIRERTGLLFSLENTCEGGFYCSGCAYALMELYISLGYESKCLDMGTDFVNTHCVTIVKLPQSGEWYVQDPTFNQTVYDKHGAMVSLNKMILLLMERKHEEIIIRGGTTIRIGCSVDDAERGYYPYVKKLKEGNGHKLFLIDMNRKYYQMDNDMEAALKRKGYPGEVVYAYLLPFSKDIYENCGIILRKA